MKFPEEPKRSNTDVWYGAGLAVGVLLILPVMIFVLAVVKAFVISTLWHWYIVPFFHLPDLPLAIAFGIGLLTSYLVPGSEHNSDKTLGEKASYFIILPLIVLLFGWIGTFFI